MPPEYKHHIKINMSNKKRNQIITSWIQSYGEMVDNIDDTKS